MQLGARSRRPLAPQVRRQLDGQAHVAVGLAHKHDGLLGGHSRRRGRLCPTELRMLGMMLISSQQYRRCQDAILYMVVKECTNTGSSAPAHACRAMLQNCECSKE